MRIQNITMNDTRLVLSLDEGNEIHLSLDDASMLKDWGAFFLKGWIEKQYESIAEQSVKREWQIIPTHFRIKSLQFDGSYNIGEKDFLAFLKRIKIIALADLAEASGVTTFSVIQTLLEIEKQKRIKVDFLVHKNGWYVKAQRRDSKPK